MAAEASDRSVHRPGTTECPTGWTLRSRPCFAGGWIGQAYENQPGERSVVSSDDQHQRVRTAVNDDEFVKFAVYLAADSVGEVGV